MDGDVDGVADGEGRDVGDGCAVAKMMVGGQEEHHEDSTAGAMSIIKSKNDIIKYT